MEVASFKLQETALGVSKVINSWEGWTDSWEVTAVTLLPYAAVLFVLEMTYYVPGGTLNPTLLTHYAGCDVPLKLAVCLSGVIALDVNNK